ncbi:MAG: hypothetical protein VKI93_03250 [Synechococcus sp.]|nr:hypothetical protein [Synechococcus sp.]
MGADIKVQIPHPAQNPLTVTTAASRLTGLNTVKQQRQNLIFILIKQFHYQIIRETTYGG